MLGSWGHTCASLVVTAAASDDGAAASAAAVAAAAVIASVLVKGYYGAQLHKLGQSTCASYSTWPWAVSNHNVTGRASKPIINSEGLGNCRMRHVLIVGDQTLQLAKLATSRSTVAGINSPAVQPQVHRLLGIPASRCVTERIYRSVIQH